MSNIIENPAQYIENGIYDDGPNYFNFNIEIPAQTPQYIKDILGNMKESLFEGRIFDFLNLQDDLDTSVKHSHMFNALSTEDAKDIFRILGWRFYGD